MRGVGVELRKKPICLRKLVIHRRVCANNADGVYGVGWCVAIGKKPKSPDIS